MEQDNQRVSVRHDDARARARRAAVAVLYSYSRVMVSINTALLSAIVITLMPSDADRIVLALTISTLISNCLASWKEQVIYRFHRMGVRKALDRWTRGETITLVIAAGLGSIVGGVWWMSPLTTALTIALAVSDAGYRTASAALQASGKDRAFIVLNVIKAASEIGTVMAFLHMPLYILAAIAVCRGALWRVAASSAATSVPPEGDDGADWRQYALRIGIWLVLIQLLVYLPQLVMARAVQESGRQPVFAVYRLFSQSVLLASGMAGIYVQPKLLIVLHAQGRESFHRAWRRVLPAYVLSVLAPVGAVAVAFPSAVRVFGEPAALEWALSTPTAVGAACLALANYVQRLVEVTHDLHLAVIPLAVATMSMGVCAMAASGGHSYAPHGVGFAFSGSLSLYLTLLCVGARSAKVAPPEIGRCLALIAVIGVVLLGISVWGGLR